MRFGVDGFVAGPGGFAGEEDVAQDDLGGALKLGVEVGADGECCGRGDGGLRRQRLGVFEAEFPNVVRFAGFDDAEASVWPVPIASDEPRCQTIEQGIGTLRAGDTRLQDLASGP